MDGDPSKADETRRVLQQAIISANDALIINDLEMREPGPRIEYVNPAFTRRNIINWLAIQRDVTAFVKAEQDLRKRNEDLNHFVRAVSHDLQEPLPTMIVRSQVLQHYYSSELPGVGLAIGQRMIENYDSKIWVESEGVGAGASFHLSIHDD